MTEYVPTSSSTTGRGDSGGAAPGAGAWPDGGSSGGAIALATAAALPVV
jgi:hypothetical protein